MLLRERNEAREHRELSPYALKSSESRGRRHAQEEGLYRPVYLRDRDRVIHSAAFRRLEYKTQVFVNNEGDYYRTRLTHTLEVAQIARSVAYSLQLNEGFVEGLALSHDLGHPPFGHAGESILDKLMEPYGGFEHNRQSLRVVDFLEKRYPDFVGLNLTYELRDSILKHGAKGCAEEGWDFDPFPQPLLEAQVVDLADRVAYTHHDLDDGLQAGILNEESLKETGIWARAAEDVAQRHPDCKGRIRLHQVTNTIIHWIISDLIETAFSRLEVARPAHALDARQHEEELIRLSPDMERDCSELNRFLYDNFYKDHKVAGLVVRSERILSDLFQGFMRRPETLHPDFRAWSETTGLERAVCDYVAGMTDRYAEEAWNRLCF